MYCFLCNKQFCYTLDITASGGNRLEFVGKNGYIHPETRQEIAMTFYCIPDEVYLRREHIEKAIEYASSNKTIRPEYEFLQQAYEAEKKHEHKLAIIHACSGLESCLLQQIDRYCNQRIIETDILTKKYKYLSDLVELGSRIDSEFAQLKEELKENVCKARNAVVHFNRNAAPNRETALKCIEAVEKALRYFYDDFAE